MVFSASKIGDFLRFGDFRGPLKPVHYRIFGKICRTFASNFWVFWGGRVFFGVFLGVKAFFGVVFEGLGGGQFAVNWKFGGWGVFYRPYMNLGGL